jgi:hypothetical protein
MLKRLNFITAISMGSLLVAQASEAETLQLQILTIPAGAAVVENDTGNSYKAPFAFNYNLANQDRNSSGCFVVKGVIAIWASGARSASPTLIQLCGSGPIWRIQLDRPPGAPNVEADIAVENQLTASQRASAILSSLMGGFLQGNRQRGNIYVPPVIPGTTYNLGSTTNQNSVGTNGSNLPQLAPDGTYVSGNRPFNICPDGSYVAGTCIMAPSGKYVGQ